MTHGAVEMPHNSALYKSIIDIDIGPWVLLQAVSSAKNLDYSMFQTVKLDILGVFRLAALEDQIQEKSRELVATKMQLEYVEADKVALKQHVNSLNKHKSHLEQLLKQSDKHGVVS